MNQSRLAAISDIERWHFWFDARRRLIRRVLQRAPRARLVLDVGCGVGSMAGVFGNSDQALVGLDLQPEALRRHLERQPQTRLLCGDAQMLPVASSSVDAVALFDVLEHVDDVALLTEVARVLRPGGWAVLTVPALPWLWGYRDTAAGHLRRYTGRRLRTLIGDAGLHLHTERHFQWLLLPAMLVSRAARANGRAMRDLEDRPPKLINEVFRALARLEVWLNDVVPSPVGSSIVALVGKA
jgi:SAM-dependent methyltransferase